MSTAQPTTQQRQHGLQADSLGFLVGQRRLERTAGNIHQDTQEMVRLLKGMLQDRVLNPPENQVRGLAAAIAMAQRQATIDIVAAIRESSGIPPIATRPTRDIGGSNSPSADLSPIPPLSTRPTLDVRSHNDLPHRDIQPITATSTATPNVPDSTGRTSDDAAGNPPLSTRTDDVRDARGRFVPRNRASGGDSAGGGDSKPWFDKVKTAVSSGVSTGMADTQGVDPTVDAINELGGLLSPVRKAAGFAFKPISMLMKRNKRNEPLPAEQDRHNREERKFWGRLVDAVRAQGNGRKMGVVGTAVATAATLGVAAGNAISDAIGDTANGVIGDVVARGMALLGSDTAKQAVADMEAADDAERYANRERNGNFGSTDRIYEVARSIGAGSLLRDWGNEQQGASNGRLGAFSAVADAVGFGEGDYNSVNRGADPRTGKSHGSTKANLSEMTINQVLARNKKPFGDPDRMNAVGKYQIIASTMKGLVSKMGLTGEEKLTPEMQDRLFMALMPNATTDYVFGRSADRNAAITGLAKEYASIGVPVDMKGYVQNVRAGQSFYQGYGGNKANPQSLSKVAAALDGARAQTVGKPMQPATPAKLPDTSQGLAEYAEIQPAPAVTSPVPAPVAPNTNMQSMIRPAAQVMSLPISASSVRQAPNLPVPQPMPKVREQISSPAPQAVTIAQSADNISQNVGDRAIAHAVTGGLGMRGWEQG